MRLIGCVAGNTGAAQRLNKIGLVCRPKDHLVEPTLGCRTRSAGDNSVPLSPFVMARPTFCCRRFQRRDLGFRATLKHPQRRSLSTVAAPNGNRKFDAGGLDSGDLSSSWPTLPPAWARLGHCVGGQVGSGALLGQLRREYPAPWEPSVTVVQDDANGARALAGRCAPRDGTRGWLARARVLARAARRVGMPEAWAAACGKGLEGPGGT